ncbi:hypothetical protein [Kitasatospora sp. NPDC057198]|uniref:hypothetical protein n=1 Tax=Kitasatospora sp. NPDC057198 TaxID=3346046 RepID=UPI003642DEAC
MPRQSRVRGGLLLVASWSMGAAGLWLALSAFSHWKGAEPEVTLPVKVFLGVHGPLWYATVAAAAVAVVAAAGLQAVHAVVLRRRPVGPGFVRLRYFLPVMGFELVSVLWTDDVLVPWWDLVLLLPLVVVAAQTLLAGARRTAVLGRQHLAEVVRDPAQLPAGSFTLYLRSFEDDVRRTALEENRHPAPGPGAAVSDLSLSVQTEEEQLARLLRPVAPMVAVGRPGERLPLVGARRLYLPIDDWQDTVLDLMRRARLVVMAVGLGPGLLWEFGEATRLLPAERLVLLLSDREEYETFRAQAAPPRPDAAPPRPALPPYPDGEPPEDLAFTGAVYFDGDWAPHLVLFGGGGGGGGGWNGSGGAGRSAMAKGLRPVLDRYRPGRHH